MCGGGGEGGVNKSGDRIFFGGGQEAKIGLYLIFGGPGIGENVSFLFAFLPYFLPKPFCLLYNYALHALFLKLGIEFKLIQATLDTSRQ